MTGTALVLALAMLPGPTPPAHPPEVVVERLIPEGGGVRRLSVFADGTAVLSAPTPTGHHLRRMVLGREELVVVLGVADRELPALQRLSLTGPARLRIRRPGGATVEIAYDPRRVPPLPLGRVLLALDELEARLRAAPEVTDAVRGWTPRPGDRVELWGGGTAVVTEVRKSGVVVLEHEGSPVIEALRSEDLPARVRGVLGGGG